MLTFSHFKFFEHNTNRLFSRSRTRSIRELKGGDVFELRTATGCELFSNLTCLHTTIFALLSMFSLVDEISLKI